MDGTQTLDKETGEILPVVVAPAKTGIFVKLWSAMAAIQGVDKRGRFTSDRVNYEYQKSEDIVAEVRRALIENRIAFIPTMLELIQAAKEKGGLKTMVRMSFTFADVDTGETYTSHWQGEADDFGDKGGNKAVTAAVKYFLIKTFLIPVDNEPDADAKNDQNKAVGRAQNAGKQINTTKQAEKAAEAVKAEKAEQTPENPADLHPTRELYENACLIVTEKGTEFGNLSNEQLDVILSTTHNKERIRGAHIIKNWRADHAS